MSKAPSMRCPHCKGKASARTSVELSLLYREVTYVCLYSLCGHVFVAGLEAIRTLSPSAMPDPEVDLPLSPHVRQHQLARQLSFALEQDSYDPA
ncbi:ogr/Delta-like zinc finger family protein [Lysobacter sp. CA199]|uniref:ogr/Delta-like zinc finger family protein n=1 Tax=Lysobacter sp. CA199 TaxID=3455608 RepID=UPI003F8D2019